MVSRPGSKALRGGMIAGFALALSASAAAQDSNSAAEQTAREAVAAATRAAQNAMANANSGSALEPLGSRPPRVQDPTRLSDRALVEHVAKLDPLERVYGQTPEFAAWARDLANAIQTAPLTTAAATLAPAHEMSAEAMHALARDWLIARATGYDFTEEKALAGARKSYIDLLVRHVAAAGHDRFALEIAAQAISLAGDCKDPGLAALLAGETDKPLASWALARGTHCPAPMRAALTAPALRTSALVMLLTSSELKDTDAIAPEAWLLRESALDRVAPEDRGALRRWLARSLIANLLDQGMDSEALARFAMLNSFERDAVLAPTMPAFEVHIDGAEFAIPESIKSLMTALAAAMVSAGRKADAAQLLPAGPAVAAKQALVDCLFESNAQEQPARGKPAACPLDQRDAERTVADAVDTLFVRQAIEGTDSDPYRLIEVGFVSRMRENTEGVLVRLRCRGLSEQQYAALCRRWRAAVAEGLAAAGERGRYADDARENIAAIAAAGLPDWPGVAEHVDRLRAAARTEFTEAAEARSAKAWSEQTPIEPDRAPFAEHALPEQLRSSDSSASRASAETKPRWPRGWAPLPKGFVAVRTEAAGQRAVAVSLSGRFDPSGEVGAGGYWVHVSDDGGKTWAVPLYTGLADHFPYVVQARSKLPMIDGDTLKLEVAIDLLDTSSITYPPVGLRTRRHQRDLTLEMPLAMLRADADHDGLTDIAAHHLLLDRGPIAPFVVGSDMANCATVNAPAQALRAKLLRRLVGGRQDRALREPIDRPTSATIGFGWASMPTASTFPLFVKGDPRDFACMQLPTPTFVYSAEGETALQRETPDFRLLDAPPLIMNRQGTRGFMQWSLGWTGGTTMAYLKDGTWHTIELESWIT